MSSSEMNEDLLLEVPKMLCPAPSRRRLKEKP